MTKVEEISKVCTKTPGHVVSRVLPAHRNQRGVIEHIRDI